MTGVARSILVFRVGDRRFGLDAEAVEGVVRMVEVVPLPQGPHLVAGVIDVGGDIVPVFAIRRRFGMEERELLPEDFLVLGQAGGRRVAMAAEEVLGVEETGARWSEPPDTGGPRPVAGLVRSEDGLILIQDLDTFLSGREEAELNEALRQWQEK